MKRNHDYFILWEKRYGIALFDGQSEEQARFFALLRLPGPRRRSDPILAASSGWAVLIGDKDPFSVLNFGRPGISQSSGHVPIHCSPEPHPNAHPRKKVATVSKSTFATFNLCINLCCLPYDFKLIFKSRTIENGNGYTKI